MLNDHPNQEGKVSNMDEVAPGIFEATSEEAAQVETGSHRLVDYMAANMVPIVSGPMSMVKEVSSHKEFSERALGIAIIDTDYGNGRLEKNLLVSRQAVFS